MSEELIPRKLLYKWGILGTLVSDSPILIWILHVLCKIVLPKSIYCTRWAFICYLLHRSPLSWSLFSIKLCGNQRTFLQRSKHRQSIWSLCLGSCNALQEEHPCNNACDEEAALGEEICSKCGTVQKHFQSSFVLLAAFKCLCLPWRELCQTVAFDAFGFFSGVNRILIQVFCASSNVVHVGHFSRLTVLPNSTYCLQTPGWAR